MSKGASGYAAQEVLDRFDSGDVAAVVDKPFDSATLADAVGRALQSS